MAELLMRALICGSRAWDDARIVSLIVRGLAHGPDPVVIVEGEAPGADKLSGRSAQRQGVEVDPYPAKWNEHDREGRTPIPCRCADDAERCNAAGVRRNEQMLREGRPDVVFAFTDDLAASTGTADMVRRANSAGLPVYVIGRAS